MDHKSLISMLSITFSRWMGHDSPRIGAALAFYALLSLAPLTVFLVAILAVIVGTPSAARSLEYDVLVVMGPSASATISNLLENGREPAHGLIATVFAILTLLVSASGVFTELKDALDTMWNVRSPYSGLRGIFARRALSFVLVVVAGFVFVLSMLATTVLSLFGRVLGDVVQLSPGVLSALNLLLSLLVFAVVFLLIYRYVPDLVLPWRVLFVGAGVTAFLFVIGKVFLEVYLGWIASNSAYGAAGSLVAIAVWVYYSAQIFLFGAEFTYIIAERTRGVVANDKVLRFEPGA